MRCSDLLDGCSASRLFEEEGLWRTSKCLTKLFSKGDVGVKKNGVTEYFNHTIRIICLGRS